MTTQKNPQKEIQELKKKHEQAIQGYKNIIDQKELEIEELKKANAQLKKKLKKEKEFSKMLYESP